MKERKKQRQEVLVCLLWLIMVPYIVQALSKDAIGIQSANALDCRSMNARIPSCSCVVR